MLRRSSLAARVSANRAALSSFSVSRPLLSQARRSITSASTRQSSHLTRPTTPQLTFPSSSPRLRALQHTSTSAASEASSTLSQAPSPEKPDFLDEAESRIWDLLMAEFVPKELSVRDISGGCGSMYGIEISSAKFRGVGMLKQQRMVNAVLGDLMKDWHGVQLKTRVP